MQVDPNQPEAHYNYGVLLMQEKRYGEAEEAFRKLWRRTRIMPRRTTTLATFCNGKVG